MFVDGESSIDKFIASPYFILVAENDSKDKLLCVQRHGLTIAIDLLERDKSGAHLVYDKTFIDIADAEPYIYQLCRRNKLHVIKKSIGGFFDDLMFESGRMFKTNKGKVLMFKENYNFSDGTDEGRILDERLREALDNALDKAHDCFAYELEKRGFKGYDGDSAGGFYFNDRKNRKTYYVCLDVTDLQECDDYEGDFVESTKKFGKKFTKENVEAPYEDLICPRCGCEDIDVDAGYATCGDCDYSWELKDDTIDDRYSKEFDESKK